ncbi:MAG: 3-hydroxy acid dehydrogenase/malonic semialdehyde reductase [Gammaproteobacteria bacterium]
MFNSSKQLIAADSSVILPLLEPLINENGVTLNDTSSNLVALVTGASSGIGKAICEQLIKENIRVIAAARNIEKLNELADNLGSRLHAFELDVTDAKSVESITSRLPVDFREIDLLINNAGHDVGGRRLFDEGSADDWCHIIETNVNGLIRVTHSLVPGMLKRQRGHVINMGSIASLKPYATGTAYVTSKSAVHAFSDTLRLDYAGRGIKVTEIMPGLVKSGFASQRLGSDEAGQAFYDSFEACLLPEDIANTVLYAINQPPQVEIAQLVVLPVKNVSQST